MTSQPLHMAILNGTFYNPCFSDEQSGAQRCNRFPIPEWYLKGKRRRPVFLNLDLFIQSFGFSPSCRANSVIFFFCCSWDKVSVSVTLNLWSSFISFQCSGCIPQQGDCLCVSWPTVWRQGWKVKRGASNTFQSPRLLFFLPHSLVPQLPISNFLWN